MWYDVKIQGRHNDNLRLLGSPACVGALKFSAENFNAPPGDCSFLQ